jgi:hypothetical protein
MNRQGHEDVDFFIGREVEHTPAFGKKTLFVIGVQPIERIQEILRDPFTQIDQPVDHVYFGANQSFTNPSTNDSLGWAPWETMIRQALDLDLWCTLDVDVAAVEGLLESGLCEYRRFIPMISVKMPYVQQLGYNATLKIDDRDFAATNPGVWCHRLNTLMHTNKFTDWDQYTKDKVLK